MFIYSFKTPGKFLLNHVVVMGQFVTFFATKSADAGMPEINFLFDQLGAESISGDWPEHCFLHNSYVDFLQTESHDTDHTHVHAKLPQNMSLKNGLDALLKLQDEPLTRQKLYADFCSALDAQRKKSNHEKLPHFIQCTLDHYDSETPFLPKDEIPTLLAEYQTYLNTRGALLFSEQVTLYMIQFLLKHQRALLGSPIRDIKGVLDEEEGHFSGFSKNFESLPLVGRLTESQQFLAMYFDNLYQLRKALMGIHYESNSEKRNTCRFHAIHLLNEMTQNPNYPFFASRIPFAAPEIMKFLQQKITPLVTEEKAEDTNLQSDASVDLLKQLKTAIAAAQEQYSTRFQATSCHGLFHHHGSTGQYRALAFYGRSTRWNKLETSLKDLQTFFNRKESRILGHKRGNLYANSFDTLLLQSLKKNEKLANYLGIKNLNTQREPDRFQTRETIIKFRPL